MKDYFISYGSADRPWAEWIAWLLEDRGYTACLQHWDFLPGSNFVLEIDRAARDAERTLLVLSSNYLASLYTQPEWASAFRSDPAGRAKKLVPVRVGDCRPEGLLASVTYIDLVDSSEAEAENRLLKALGAIRKGDGRMKPDEKPFFPGTATGPDARPVSRSTADAGDLKDTAAVRAGSTTLAVSEMLERLVGLPRPYFDSLLINLRIPFGEIPELTAQRDRAVRLIEFAESPAGPGLLALNDALQRVLARPR